MSIISAISKLQEARGDPQKLTLATLDIILSTREGWLREALETVAIPHWFTAASIAELLEVDDATAARYLEGLTALPMVETFAGRDGWNVHEATRLALRSQLAREEPERFRRLSMRAAETFRGEEPYQKVEWIYHLLVAAPTEETSRRLNDLWYGWDAAGQYQSQQMLAVALRELLAAVPLEQVSRARALLCHGMSAIRRIPASQVEDIARESVSIFQALRDPDSESDARCLLGDALSIQGRREEALHEYQEFKQIMLELTKRDPGNAGWLRELLVSHGKVGEILDAEGRRDEALREYQEFKRIALELTKRDPSNTRWLRDLAMSHSRVGGLQQDEGRREEALREYQESKRIVLELTKRDPGNASWLRDLGVSHAKVGGILEAEGRREEALREYQEYKRIALELTKRDPSNTGWMRDLSVSHVHVGGILQAEGRREEALREYQEDKRIALELTKRDPGNAGWLRDLSVSHNRTAAVISESPERLEDALSEHERSVEIAERLVRLDPGRQQWAEDLRAYRAWVDIVRERLKVKMEETPGTG